MKNVDPDMPAELRALYEAKEARELTPAEERRRAELITLRLQELTRGIQLAASPITAEVDQMVAGVQGMIARIEALGEQPGVSLADASPDGTRQLACDLLRAAKHLILYSNCTWDGPELERVRQELTCVDDTLSWAERDHAESLARWEAELGREDEPAGTG